MVSLTRIRTGKIPPSTPGKEVPTEQWRFLLDARRSYCNQQFQCDCKELLFYIDDGRKNDFFGYPDEVTYWRDGLCLEPEAVPFAENYLRTRRARLEAGIDGQDWRDIPFGEAVKLGKHGGDRKSEAAKDQGCNTTLKRGTRAHWLARLDRDGHAELAAKVRAGEMSSNAAAIEAGFRKRLTPAECILKGLPKLSRAQLQHVRARIDQLLGVISKGKRAA